MRPPRVHRPAPDNAATMVSISLGPFALPLAPLLLLLAVLCAAGLARRLAGPARRAAADGAVFMATGLGLLAARAFHLALNTEAYAATPLAVFDIRDGGWNAPAGWLAGMAWLLWRASREQALRRPLAVALSAGAVLWFGASGWLGPAAGAPMPPVAVVGFPGGATLTLPQAARGRPVVINLWASWCGPCRAEMPLLAAAQQRESAVGFLFVNQGESPEAVQAYLIDQDLPLREVLLDRGSALGPAVGSRGLPTTLFYDAAGRQVDVHFGVLNAAALETRLRALRQNR